MKPLFYVFAIFMIVSCSKERGLDCCMNISMNADISLKNTAGEDLLNPENFNSYKEREIKTYHLIDGIERIAHTEEFLFKDNDGLYRLRVFLNDEGNDEYPTTYIDWNETDRDTLKSEIYRTNNQVRVVKIWYNDSLMWDAEDLGPEQFTIIK